MKEIYTDGSYQPHARIGTWAFVVIEGGKVIECDMDHTTETTNNAMEMMACIQALESFEGEELTIYTDSAYVLRGMTERLEIWKLNGWRTKKGKPLKNKWLWERLDLASSKSYVSWIKVKAHSGNKFNNAVDRLCRL